MRVCVFVRVYICVCVCVCGQDRTGRQIAGSSGMVVVVVVVDIRLQATWAGPRGDGN